MAHTLEHHNLSRRRFLQWLIGLSATSAAAVGYVRIIEPRWLAVEQIEIPVANLTPSLDGKRIAQLSDIHLSQYFSPDRLAHALEEVKRQAPDWLLITGDFVGTNAQDAAGLVGPLRALSIPIHVIYGNHDYWSDNATVTRYLREAGVNILRNQGLEIEANLWLAGVDDLWAGDPDLHMALSDIPTGAPTVLLAHEPDFFDTVLHEEAPIFLQLSGHSHGGQIRVPTLHADDAGFFSYAPVLPRYGRRYPIGLRQINGRVLYTNRGLGTWPMPVRFNCRPELTIFTLRVA